jgi:hypothetical protein
LSEEQKAAERRLEEALQLASGPQPASLFVQQDAQAALSLHAEACERLIEHRSEHGC